MDADKKWQQAALDCFDNSKKDFQAVKREYFEDNSLYAFRGGHEKEDFIGKMLQKIMKDLGFGFYGRKLLRESSLNI